MRIGKVTDGFEIEEDTRAVLTPKAANNKPEKVPYQPWDDFGKAKAKMNIRETRPVFKVYANCGKVRIWHVPLDIEKRYYIQLSRDRKKCRICEAQPNQGRKISRQGYAFEMSIGQLGHETKTLTYLIDTATLEGTLIE